MKYKIHFLIFILFSITLSAQTVTTLAGSCNEVYHGLINGNGSAARFYIPKAIAVDSYGNLYVADSGNNCVRKISTNGNVTTIAGSSSNYPTGVAVDIIGNVYISDTNNHRILKIDVGSSIAIVLAGSGAPGNGDGIGVNAEFNTPMGIAVDALGNVYVADSYNHRIRKIDSSGLVTTLAGSSQGNINAIAIAAKFDFPVGVAIDALGNIFVADRNNNQIKKIEINGMVSTYIGNGNADNVDGVGPTVSLRAPLSLTISSDNTIYVISGNNTIRKVTPTGEVSIFVGNPNLTWGGCLNGDGLNAEFLHPYGISIDPIGNLYIADTGNHTLRKVTVNLSTNNPKLEDKINLFPNPAANTINISIEDFTSAQTTIFDTNGKILQTNIITKNNTAINIGNLAKGIYLMQIQTNLGIVTKKIVKE